MQPSATLAIADKARTLRRQGVDVLSFSVGEPDFATPPNIRDAAKRALNRGAGKYTAVAGIPELKEAIINASKRRRDAEFGPENIAVSVGAKHSLFNLAACIIEPGDEVIIPAPYWVSYPAQVKIMGGVPRTIETSAKSDFMLTADQLRSALTPKTKAIILCSPSNPTGAAYRPEMIAELAKVLADHDCYIVLDEIYGELTYGDFQQKSFIDMAPELRERIVIIDGVSKTYAMTGWRIGWTIADKSVASAISKVQSQSTSNPAAVSQWAAVEALSGPQDAVAEMRGEFASRREVMVDGLNKLDGFSCRTPEGAFYAFPDISHWMGAKFAEKMIANDLDFAEFLISEAHCAVVPGTAFGAPGHIRMSYATDPSTIREGLRRIEEALKKLSI